MGVPALSQPVNLDFLHRGRVWIMGVLNVTPDSFYPRSRTLDISVAIPQAARMLTEGADLLDIGGESTRPGAVAVLEQEELLRVLPVIDAVHRQWPEQALSIDTQKAEVARQAAAHGVSVVNDISALRQDPEMARVVAESGCVVVLMHMQGTPQTMQQDPRYGDVMDELDAFFEERMAYALRQGIAEEKIILDPGIGFGKTVDHNLTILSQVSKLKRWGRPLLIGLSRKSFIAKMLASAPGPALPPEDRLEGSLAATLWAVQQGVEGVRVHDVGATRQAIQVWQKLDAGSSLR